MYSTVNLLPHPVCMYVCVCVPYPQEIVEKEKDLLLYYALKRLEIEKTKYSIFHFSVFWQPFFLFHITECHAK